MKKDATLSQDRVYRYALWRIWDDSLPYVMIIGLNPSTADETEDDRTIHRCMNFAKNWGYGGLCMANLFAFRATDQGDLFSAKDPVGEENDHWLEELAKKAGIVVAAWGNSGSYLDRSAEVRKKFNGLYCIKINKSGEPAHPLYLDATLKPIIIK